MKLSALWDLLSHVQTLKLRAVSFEPAKTVWTGDASGRVVLSKTDQNTLIFSESGEWNFSEKPKIKFFNVYRWQMAGEEILRLSHLRHGIDSPVHLLDFKKSAVGGNWHSEKPHICREDLYSAVLSVEADSISLKWTINGPEKKQTVECSYHF